MRATELLYDALHTLLWSSSFFISLLSLFFQTASVAKPLEQLDLMFVVRSLQLMFECFKCTLH